MSTRNARSRKSRWTMHPIPQGLRQQQHLPETLPVPSKQTVRVDKGNVSHGELARWLRNFEEEHPDDPKAAEYLSLASRFEVFQEGADALSEGRYAEAEEKFREALSIDQDDYLSSLNLAIVLDRLDQTEEAMKLIDTIPDSVRNSPRAIILRSRLLNKSGQRDEALRLLRLANQRQPDNFQFVRELQGYGALIPVVFNPRDLRQTRYVTPDKYAEMMKAEIDRRDQKRDYKSLGELAEFHLEDNKPAVARMAAERLLRSDRHEVEALRLKGLAELRLGEKEEAAKTLEAARSKDAKNARVLVALGRQRFAEEQKDEAKQLFEEAFRLDPEFIQAAELYVLVAEGEEARMAAALALKEQFPESWVPTKLIGDLEFGADEVEDALEKHIEAFRASDADDALTMILHEYDRLNRLDEAVDLINEQKNLQKRSAAVRWNAANIFLKKGQTQAAVQILERMVGDTKLPHETRFAASSLLADVYTSTSAGERRPAPAPRRAARRPRR